MKKLNSVTEVEVDYLYSL